MKRGDKIRAIKRYLTAYSGIPLISWDGSSSQLDAPSPYFFVATTNANGWKFFEEIRELPEDKIGMVIRYDKYIDGTDNAVVGMRLSTLTSLLSVHYDSISSRTEPIE